MEEPSQYPLHAITEAYARKLEQILIDKPDYWLWSHKRWKHKRPSGV
jgi:KDO2-lipid IV(A) lauroyltransferase